MIEFFTNNKGFTFVEMTVTLTVIMVILGMSVLYSQATQVRSDLNGQVTQFVSRVRLAQSDAKAGKEGLDHGIYMKFSEYVVFSGDSYVEDADGNIVMDLPGTITIQNIILNGGGSEVLFASPDGETTNYGTVDFVAQNGSTTTITITQIGTVDY